MKIVILTSDNREPLKRYDLAQPIMPPSTESLLQGFARLPEVEVHVVSCLQTPVRTPEKLADNIWFHSLHVSKIGWLRTLYQGCVRAVRKKLREIQPDIVHGEGTERDSALDAVFSGFPSVLTIHGNMRIIARVNQVRPFSFVWLAAKLETFTIPRADGVVCITNYTRKNVADLAKKTWVVPNAVDESFFEVRPEIDSARPPIILCVGYICLRKNQNAFIRALDPLAAKQKFRLLFLGEAASGESYGREFFGLLRARAWCEHVGFVDRKKLKTHLGKATLLALPSLEDNCPMVILEAAAANVPVVAANVGGVPDLIEEGKTGLLCDPQSAASMGDAVKKILEQPQLARALAAEANRRAHECFHPAVVARRHFEIYREVLAKKTF